MIDFFEQQERARRKTGVLIFYFILALLGIVGATYALAMGVMFFVEENPAPTDVPYFRPDILTYTALGTGFVVFVASLYKAAQLSGGGAVVARELGGREIDRNTTDYHERRLLNVVEEMAIASGVPVPTVYVMDREGSINAFAAGKTTSDAVIGVTRGCMTLLTRDELQGVIAHEFSHILNGDMRLNIRLMGILFGILFLALMGELILRIGVRGGLESGRKEGVGAALFMLVIGLGLLAIGYLGHFFGNLIKASVSRQREFLADASAVQFTRNPDGLAGALMKIGGLKSGSEVRAPMARDASHLFFGSAFSSSLLATHPPLQKRIKLLLPHWNGEFGAARLAEITPETERATSFLSPSKGAAVDALGGEEDDVSLSEDEAIRSTRALHPEQVELGQAIHAGIPASWLATCHDSAGARSMILALLLAQDDALREAELAFLHGTVSRESFHAVSSLFPEVGQVHSRTKLALVDLCLPTLRHLSTDEYGSFRETMVGLITSDERVDLFEFALLKVVQRHLDSYFLGRKPPKMKYRSVAQLGKPTALLLSTLASLSHEGDEQAARSAFAYAIDQVSEGALLGLAYRPAGEDGLDEIEEALDEFEKATPIVKRQLVAACSRSVLSDGKVSSAEAEMIRAIADAIGCPIPPFVKTATLG